MLEAEYDALHEQDSPPAHDRAHPSPHSEEDSEEDICDLTGFVPNLSPPSPLSHQPPQPPTSPAPKYGKAKKASKPDFLRIPSLDPVDLGAVDFTSASLLAFPAPGKDLDDDTRARAVAAMALFNGTVWFERSYYFKMMSVAPPIEEATNWLADIAALDHLHVFGPKTACGLGSAGKRTASQKKAAVAYGAQLLADILPNSLVAFTDGSASPNPGPCGAGALLYHNVEPGWDTERFAALGQGTNNLGELWAVGLALQAAHARISSLPEHPYKQLYVFTDSQFTRGILTLGWKSSQHAKLSKVLKQYIRDFPVPVLIEWVPAHVGIWQNERADKLADLGTAFSKEHGPNVDVTKDLSSRTFAPPIYDG